MTTAKSNITILEGQRLMTREQAAVYCNMSPNSFDKHMRRLLISRKFGRIIMYDRKQIDEALDLLYEIRRPSQAGESEAMRLLGS